jgi:hypothetical protein
MRTLFHFYKNKPEWMNEMHGQLAVILKEKKRLLIFISIPITLLWFALFFSHSHNSESDLDTTQIKRSETIMRELSQINAVLHDVESNPVNTKQQQIALQTLEQNITSIQKSIIGVAKGDDIQKVSSQIASVKEDFDVQISDLKKTVSEGSNSKQYIEASTLPFHVISVDVIAGQSYVSVEYANHISPLAIGDVLAGWRTVNADYDAGVCEFVNEKNQYVKVNIHGA